MQYKHVTILPQGDLYCIRVGLFLTSIGEDTRKAMNLPEGTRFEQLSRPEAERLALLVDEWIGGEWKRQADKRKKR